MLFLLVRLIVGIGAIWQLSARSDDFNDLIPYVHSGWKRSVNVSARAIAITVPMVWGLFRPVILLPALMRTNWQPERQRAVLLHELAHIQRQDWLMQTMARITCAMYWFNPLCMVCRTSYAGRRRNVRAMIMYSTQGINQLTMPNTCSILCEISRRCAPFRGRLWRWYGNPKLRGGSEQFSLKHRNRKPMTKIAVVIGLLALICFAVPMGVMRLTKAVDPIDDPALMDETYEHKEQIYGLMADGTRWRTYDLLRAELHLG